MSIPYVESGRTRQKSRTRDALIAAARTLIERGTTPTVEDAAAEASISRTTAYRYFPNQRSLLLAVHPHVEARSLLPHDAPTDAAERLEIVLDAYLEITIDNEAALRMAFVLSLDRDADHSHELLLRRGRVIGWLKDALEPLRGSMSAKEVERLALAIRSAAGIEALIWLTDIGKLSQRDALKLMKWSAHALLQAAIAES